MIGGDITRYSDLRIVFLSHLLQQETLITTSFQYFDFVNLYFGEKTQPYKVKLLQIKIYLTGTSI